MRVKDKERLEAIEQLKQWIKPGDTVYTVLDHVSWSGMTRHIRVVVPMVEGKNGNSTVDFIHPNYSVAKACGYRQAKRGDGLVVGGCGMDMGFSVVYDLSHVLYGEGYKCLGEGKCPSAYHSNHRSLVSCPNHCRFDREKLERIYWTETEPSEPVKCEACDNGYVPNPEGPQRFDLIHKDGYALRHKWL